VATLAALTGAVVLLAVGAAAATAAPTSQSDSTSTCWKDVINDWLQHEPNVVGTYAIPCYTEAIQHLDSYADIQGYSNAPDDIRRALLAALHNEGGGNQGGGNNSSSSGPSSPSGGGGGGKSSGGGGGSSTPAPNRNPVTRFFDTIGPGDAQSVPLPLLVLAGLAILLLLAAAGTWFAKRLQSRRVHPAPAPAPRD
jgi:hypothetical protein